MCCCYIISRIWFWAADTPPSPLLPSSVSSACVTPTDGNNFSQLLRKWERPAARTVGVSLAPPVLRSGCREPSLRLSVPRSSISHLVPPLWMGVLPFKILCFHVPLSCAPQYLSV